MRRRDKLPELLAPAGDFESLVAAVMAGADAVYVGGRSFSARAFAKNFDTDELARAVRYTHLYGVKLYVTVNTLIYDREMEALSDYAETLYNIGVDAVIASDLGAIREIRRRAPDLKIHASTQMSVHNLDGAREAAKIGAERVVLARELSKENIAYVTDNAPIETEIFLHGALCVCHSGQCLMSSLVGGRSGNRGECAQPCRLPYNNGKYILSLTDLSLADHVRELIMSGVSSLKIEGRMKSPDYVYNVTKIYRTLLDEARDANKGEKDLLARAFSRGGFSDSYFLGDPLGKLLGIRSERDKVLSDTISKGDYSPKRKKVMAKAYFRLGEASKMTLYDEKRTVTVKGEIPTEAISAPLTESSLKLRLSKMGNTFLALAPEDIEITLDGNINLPPSFINSLRREAAEAFEGCAKDAVSNTPYTRPARKTGAKEALVSATFYRDEVYFGLRSDAPDIAEKIDIAYLPITYRGEFSEKMGIYLPPVIFDSELSEIEAIIRDAALRGAKYALVSNIGHIAIAKKAGLTPCGDFRLNISNVEADAAYAEMGVVRRILSPELTLPMARDIGGGEITLGRIPLMVTERCFMKDNFGCERCGSVSLSDRTGARFPILREYKHRNVIFNSAYTYMGDKRSDLSSYGISHSHFIFSTESKKEALSLLRSYFEGKKLPYPTRRIGKRDFEK